jgi:hypothetical protein
VYIGDLDARTSRRSAMMRFIDARAIPFCCNPFLPPEASP